MIDLKDELQNYPIINLNAIVEDESQIPDNIRNSVVLYNNAIENIKMGSEDIAIIELKKSIAVNANFYEAMNLLGLCYYSIGEYDKAEEMFNKVISAENNSIRALNYLNKLNRNEQLSLTDSSRKKSGSRRKFKSNSNKKKTASILLNKNNLKSEILKYIIGFILGGVVVLIFSLSAFSQNKLYVKGMETEINELNKKISFYQEKYNDKNKDYNDLQNELEKANKELDYYSSVIKLYEIEKLVSENKYEEAADMLLLMKTIEFKEGDMKKFDALYEKVMPLAASQLYDKGFNLCHVQKKYEEAAKILLKVETYMKDFSKMDAVLYYLGKSYQGLHDYEKAKDTYNRILNEYPQSTFVRWANYRLSEMQ